MEIFPVIDGALQLPEDLRYLKSQQFASRQDIRRVTVPRGVGFMEEEVFAECPYLEEVILPEGLINIGVAAFADCPRLRRVVLPSTVRTIGEGAFLGCEALREIRLPAGLEEIGAMAFQNAGLWAVEVPAGVRVIGEDAFFECESLTRADVLGKDTVIETNAFGSNYQLTGGYIAPGYPAEKSPPAELLYTLLWCSCPERHDAQTGARAQQFIRRQEALIMEWIFRQQNIPALHTLVRRKLLQPGHTDAFLRQALDLGQAEMTALLLQARAASREEEEFEL